MKSGVEGEAMARLSRKREAELAKEFESDANDDGQWEEAPAPVERSRGSLGTQVTVRLDPVMAEQLREVARNRNVGYTSLLRAWIEERLGTEMAIIERGQAQIGYAGGSVERDALHVSAEGEVKLLRRGAA